MRASELLDEPAQIFQSWTMNQLLEEIRILS